MIKFPLIKLCTLLLMIVCLLLPCVAVSTHAESEIELDVKDNVGAAYLYSYNANRVLFSVGEDKILSPGPTAKIVTGLIACERFSDQLDNTVIITPEMLENVSGNRMNIKAGMQLTVRDLIYGTICGGNNDAAEALALLCADSRIEFIRQMNTYADKLSMTSTHYVNPTGIDSDEAQTTIDDMATLARAAAENPLYMQISSAPSYDVEPQGEAPFTVYNRNALASQFSAIGYLNKNAKGIIAGRDDSGFSVVALSEKNDIKMLCIVMAASSNTNEIYSYYTANRLFDYTSKNYSKIKIADSDENMGRIDVNFSVNNGETAKVACVLADDVYAYLPYNTDVSTDISHKVYFHHTAYDAPIYEGMVVGGIDFYYKEQLVATGKIITSDSAEANKLLVFLTNSKSFLTSRFFVVFISLLLILLTVYFVFERKLRKKRRGRIKEARKLH